MTFSAHYRGEVSRDSMSFFSGFDVGVIFNRNNRRFGDSCLRVVVLVTTVCLSRMKNRHEHWVCWISTGRRDGSCDQHTGQLFLVGVEGKSGWRSYRELARPNRRRLWVSNASPPPHSPLCLFERPRCGLLCIRAGVLSSENLRFVTRPRFTYVFSPLLPRSTVQPLLPRSICVFRLMP